MRRELETLAVMSALSFMLGCPSDSGSTGPNGGQPPVSTAAEARAAFAALKSAAEQVDRGVAVNFSGPVSVAGAAGSASVTGRKTSSSSSTYTSTSTTRTSDLIVGFEGFRSAATGSTISGRVRWYDYYYSRTACSSSMCASASDHSEALQGSDIRIAFTYDGKTHSDEIDVDADSGRDTSSWDVVVTNRAGQRFSFTYR